METAVDARAQTKAQVTQAGPARESASRLLNPLLICSVAVMLALVLVIGIVRLFHSLNDGTISAWRLLLLFANIFGCVTVVCALYGRGRDRSRRVTHHRVRAS